MCGAWNTLVETRVASIGPPGRRRPRSMLAAEPVSLAELASSATARVPSGVDEYDRVLGGGIVGGSLTLLAGEPGVGKSTLALTVAAALAARLREPVLYVSGEESPGQVHLRASRLGILSNGASESLRVLGATDVETVVDAAHRLAPRLLVVDSIQSLTTDGLEGPAGSVGQVRECAQRLLLLAKGEGAPILLIGHVTKDGSVAGPKTLEHLVDVVLGFDGDPGGGVRTLRATKNRFGSTEEVGLFEMVAGGLRPLTDVSAGAAANGGPRPPGSAVALLLEGSRPMAVEVQALVGGGGYGPPRRVATGIDLDRIVLLAAALGKRAGVGLGSHDLYVSLAGGLRSREPALDLPLALAIASSLRDRPLAPGTVAAGEVSLAGEIRPVAGLDRRLREAARLGYTRAIVAPGADREIHGLKVIGVGTLRDALAAGLDRGPADRVVGPGPARTRQLGPAAGGARPS